ncbi:MAG: nucleotidyltransferase domain-containing protein [Christensenellales bacterium]
MDVIRSVLDRATAALKTVPGIQAVVLGGSRARGTHSADSDIDMGIYYSGSASLDLSALDAVARQLDDEHRAGLIASPGEWGKWVNGGGWLIIDKYHVDFILRDIGRVETAIHECRNGLVSAHYQAGHPHAYMNAMYMGELAVSRVLWDATGEIWKLKAVSESYPSKMKTAIIQIFIFEAGFSHMLAMANAQKNDLYYVTAHLVRSVSCLNQMLFAINEQYCLNEKKAVKMIETFPEKPADYKGKVDHVFYMVGKNPTAACDNWLD